MSILIDAVRISCFRGLNDLEIPLSRVTVLIGANNAGKTSVLKALQLALGDYSRYFSEEDFFIDENGVVSDKVTIDIKIVPESRNGAFSEEWQEEFEDKIRSEANGDQFLAIRTSTERDSIKGGFSTLRYYLDRWPEYSNWLSESTGTSKQLRKKIDSLAFTSIEAQRDIHIELRDKSSFVGKVLSSVEYNSDDIERLEGLVQVVNDEAVQKSQSLQNLKGHLERLSKSFRGSGHAEITPFPKRIRDLSKQFTVHFGEEADTSFSMEYHGMGTRSWASMLTVKAFIELVGEKHNLEAKQFFPIISAEEPEAHLHPNAQRTLYKQLSESNGQVLISTHSPYLAAIAKQDELRSLVKINGRVCVNRINSTLTDENKRKIQREVIHSRGELFFSNAIVLSEGETEEQSLPLLFSKYFSFEPFEMGVNFIGVGGSGEKYRPFLSFAYDFKIPVFIFSDGEEIIKNKLKKVYESIFGNIDIDNCNLITILDGTDFEGYLLDSGFSQVIESAIIDIDGAGAVDTWIQSKQGLPLKMKKSDEPDCPTCNQPILETPYRDYHVPDGRRKAITEIIDSKKPKYALAITNELCKLEPAHFPPKIIELFDKIKREANL
ncbi:TPA: AAA family ATPase [Yersinia enterocolitica]|nr:AAA family ATPase [Yersinia enterocolitica]